jgi:RNA polymerase-binding transcription factor
MDAKEVERYKRSLLAKRREIEAAAIGTVRSAGERGERQADVIDQATEAAQADLHVHLHQTDSRLLRAIEEALARIEQGTFGMCGTCNRPISTARLDAVPWTRLCHDCKEKQQS